MKQKVTAGGELDLLTPDELRQVMLEVASGFMRPPQPVREDFMVGLDSGGYTNSAGASGGSATRAGVGLFRVPVGYSFRMHRLGIFPEGYTFGAPYTSNTGYAEIRQGGNAEDGISFTTPGLPQVWTAGTADGLFYSNAQAVGLYIAQGPASKNVLVRIRGTLDPETLF